MMRFRFRLLLLLRMIRRVQVLVMVVLLLLMIMMLLQVMVLLLLLVQRLLATGICSGDGSRIAAHYIHIYMGGGSGGELTRACGDSPVSVYGAVSMAVVVVL